MEVKAGKGPEFYNLLGPELYALKAGTDLADISVFEDPSVPRSGVSIYRPGPVRVTLPKFKVKTSYQLANTLQAMGMARAFKDPAQPGGADFSGMTGSGSADDRLVIGLAMHGTYIDLLVVVHQSGQGVLRQVRAYPDGRVDGKPWAASAQMKAP